MVKLFCRIITLVLVISISMSMLSCNKEEEPKVENSLENIGNDTVESSDENGTPNSFKDSDDSIFISDDDTTGTEEQVSDTTATMDTEPEDAQTEGTTEAKGEEMPIVDSNLPLSGMRICVDAGHGSFEKSYQEAIGPGSSQTKPAFVSGTSGDYQTEAEFNLSVALMLQSLLEEQGAVVYMTRTDENATLSNIGRAELGNDNGCDISVRIHADGSENSTISGISMLVPARNQFLTDDVMLNESYKAGEIVLDCVLEKTGAKDRGVIGRDDLTGFNWSTIPSILIECGFMSNPSEDALLADPGYQMLIAEGLCQGLIEYFNN